MQRQALIFTENGKQFLVTQLEIEESEDPGNLALWIGQCLQEAHLFEPQEGLTLERTEEGRWRVSLAIAPPEERDRPCAPESDPESARRAWQANLAKARAARAQKARERREAAEPGPDPVLARALGAPIEAEEPAVPDEAAVSDEDPAERFERLLHRYNDPGDPKSAARAREAAARRYLETSGPADAMKVAYHLSITREGARKLLERLVSEGQLGRTEAPAPRARGVVGSVAIQYHLLRQTGELPPPDPPTADQRLLEVLREGPKTVAEIAAVTGQTCRTVSQRLKQLQADRKVRHRRISGEIPRWEAVG